MSALIESRGLMDSLTCVWKKSISQDYGVLGIKALDGCTIEWIRCMTCKEALKKIEAKDDIKVAVIEDVKDKDTDIVMDMIRAGVKVVLLGGSEVIAGAINMAGLAELNDWLLKYIKGDSDVTQVEASEELGREEEETDTPLVSISESDVDYSKYEAVVGERNHFRNLYMNTKDELNQLKQVFDSLMVDEEVVEQLGSGVDVREIQKKLQLADAEITRLNKRVEELGVNRSEHRTVELQLEKAESEKTKLRLLHQTDVEALEVIRDALIQASYYGREIIDQLGEANNRVKMSKQDVIGVENKLAKAQETIEQRNEKIKELEANITSITRDLEDVKESNEELSLDLKQALTEKDSIAGELTATRDRLNAELKKEESNLDELSDREKELATLRAYDIDAMVNEIAQNKEIISQYNKAMSELQLTTDALRSENADLKQKIDNYSIMANTAHNKMVAHDRIAAGDYGAITSIDPLSKGKATMVAVYGSGGRGTTSVATAVAERLASKGHAVAIVDMDFRSPKIDGVYKKSPILDSLSDIIYIDARRTALTALIKLEQSRFIDNFNKLGQVVNVNRRKNEGVLVYYSGVYDNITATEIAGAHYDTLFRQLGIEFDYIVLDMGRLEGNGAIANLQAGIANCTDMNYLVSSSTFEDVRSLNVRVLQSKMRMTNSCWVLNMCFGRVQENTMKLITAAASNMEIPLIRDMYGTDFSLAENKKTADCVDMLCAYIS